MVVRCGLTTVTLPYMVIFTRASSPRLCPRRCRKRDVVSLFTRSDAVKTPRLTRICWGICSSDALLTVASHSIGRFGPPVYGIISANVQLGPPDCGKLENRIRISELSSAIDGGCLLAENAFLSAIQIFHSWLTRRSHYFLLQLFRNVNILVSCNLGTNQLNLIFTLLTYLLFLYASMLRVCLFLLTLAHICSHMPACHLPLSGGGGRRKEEKGKCYLIYIIVCVWQIMSCINNNNNVCNLDSNSVDIWTPSPNSSYHIYIYVYIYLSVCMCISLYNSLCLSLLSKRKNNVYFV